MTTSATAQPTPPPPPPLTDAERTRLARKDVQNRGIELEKTMGKSLQAYYLVALNVERSQVQADRTGAMMAATQEQSVAAATQLQETIFWMLVPSMRTLRRRRLSKLNWSLLARRPTIVRCSWTFLINFETLHAPAQLINEH